MEEDTKIYQDMVDETIRTVLKKYPSHTKNDEDLLELKEFIRDSLAVYTVLLFTNKTIGLKTH